MSRKNDPRRFKKVFGSVAVKESWDVKLTTAQNFHKLNLATNVNGGQDIVRHAAVRLLGDSGELQAAGFSMIDLDEVKQLVRHTVLWHVLSVLEGNSNRTLLYGLLRIIAFQAKDVIPIEQRRKPFLVNDEEQQYLGRLISRYVAGGGGGVTRAFYLFSNTSLHSPLNIIFSPHTLIVAATDPPTTLPWPEILRRT